MSKRFLTAAASIALAMAGVGAAEAQSARQIIGTYGFVGTETCLSSVTGFLSDANGPRNAIAPSSSNISTQDGTITFDGGGNGSIVVNTLNSPDFRLTPTTGAGNVEFSSGTAKFTYVMHDDGFTTTPVAGTDVGMFTAGPLAGTTYLITGLPGFTGYISGPASGRNHQVAMNTSNLAVETVTYNSGSVVYQVCGRTRVLIKLDADDTN